MAKAVKSHRDKKDGAAHEAWILRKKVRNQVKQKPIDKDGKKS